MKQRIAKMIFRLLPRTKNRPPGAARVASLLVALVSTLAYAVAPPANTQIGNQASATYTDASNTQRTATSNVVVTVVQQVASFTLTTDGQGKPASPGGQVVFPHTLTNTGNGADTFTLAVANNSSGDNFDLTTLTLYADANGDGVADNSTPITSTGALASGATFKFVASGIVPGSATATQTAAISVTALGTATGTPAPLQTNTDTTTVTSNAVINVTKSMSAAAGAAGSGPYTVTLTYANTGNATAVNFTLTDPLPAGLTYVATSARWSVTGAATVLTDANDGAQGTVPNTIIYDFGATVAGRVTAVIAQVAAGETRTLTFQVNIAAGQATGALNNTASFTYDPGTGTAVGPFNTNTASFSVTPSAAVTISGSTVPSAGQGSTVSFSNVVTNTGNGPDSFDITVANTSFPAGTTFQLFKSDGVTPLVDTNGNSTADSGPLAAGGTYTVIVKATLPPGSAGVSVNYTAAVTATSKLTPATSASANDVLTTVTASTVDLTNTRSISGGATATDGLGAGPEASTILTRTVNPGATTTFPIFVNNTSGAADSYDLAASTVSSFASLSLPSGWSVVFTDAGGATVTNTGSIAAGGSKAITAVVTLPAGQVPGATQLYFRALSPTTAASDRLHDTVTVNAVRSLAITPNNSGPIAAGGTAVFSHLITNNGNTLEGDSLASSVALSQASSLAGWSAVAYYDANGNGVIDPSENIVTDLSFVSGGAAGLAPGESVRLLVKVTAPGNAAVGAIDAVTFSATTTNGTYTTTVPAVASATDSASVVASDILITKEQALDANNDGTPDTAYAIADITSGALPGKCIRYRITVRNTGNAPATSVRVSDTTPAYTTYFSTSPAAVTGGTSPAVLSGPLNGAAGAFVFDVGTLNPGEQAVITFGVKIDQ